MNLLQRKELAMALIQIASLLLYMGGPKDHIVFVAAESQKQKQQHLLKERSFQTKHQGFLRSKVEPNSSVQGVSPRLRRRLAEEANAASARAPADASEEVVDVDLSSDAAGPDATSSAAGETDASSGVADAVASSGATDADTSSGASTVDNSSGGTDAQSSSKRCIDGFEQLAFSFVSFDRYNNFFHDDSAVDIDFGTRQFVGRRDIEEYMKFGTPLSPYFMFPEKDELTASVDPIFFNVDVNGICHFWIPLCSSETSSVEAEGEGEASENEVTKTTLSVTALINYDPLQNYIPYASIYYNDDWIRSSFGHNSKSTRNFQCQNLLN